LPLPFVCVAVGEDMAGAFAKGNNYFSTTFTDTFG